jgi:hypothetical protein
VKEEVISLRDEIGRLREVVGSVAGELRNRGEVNGRAGSNEDHGRRYARKSAGDERRSEPQYQIRNQPHKRSLHGDGDETSDLGDLSFVDGLINSEESDAEDEICTPPGPSDESVPDTCKARSNPGARPGRRRGMESGMIDDEGVMVPDSYIRVSLPLR